MRIFQSGIRDRTSQFHEILCNAAFFGILEIHSLRDFHMCIQGSFTKPVYDAPVILLVPRQAGAQ
jgi:hypothetical protein